VTLVLGNQVQIWLARCFTSGDVFDFISLTTFSQSFSEIYGLLLSEQG